MEEPAARPGGALMGPAHGQDEFSLVTMRRMSERFDELNGLKWTMEVRDRETSQHSDRVARLVRETLTELGSQGDEVEAIVWAAAIHDIGKLAVSSRLLAKTGQLTLGERKAIELHAAAGADRLARYPHLDHVGECIHYHHERWDGRGYPDGLAGTEIPFGARVIAVADSFDAMTSNRPYQPAMPVYRAAAVLRAGRWEQWDGTIVDAFLQVIDRRRAAERVILAACA
jgi:HD-GYP domain-containing protein (c-di-GMP phosphodiesterase class II)